MRRPNQTRKPPSSNSRAPQRDPKGLGTGGGLGGAQVEGRQSVRELLRAGKRRVKEVWVSDSLDDAPILDEIAELCRENRVTLREAARTRIDAMAQTDNPQGVVAKTTPLDQVQLEDLFKVKGSDSAPFIVAFDGVTDPHNLGSLLRSAECAGATGVVLPKHRSAHITPTVAKVAAGAVEYLPMALVAGLASAVTTAKEAGIWVVGLDMDADVEISKLPVADQPVMVILGAEGDGISRLVRQRCDVVAAIPQNGQIDSLNVSAAGAVAFFEVSRQRRS